MLRGYNVQTKVYGYLIQRRCLLKLWFPKWGVGPPGGTRVSDKGGGGGHLVISNNLINFIKVVELAYRRKKLNSYIKIANKKQSDLKNKCATPEVIMLY